MENVCSVAGCSHTSHVYFCAICNVNFCINHWNIRASHIFAHTIAQGNNESRLGYCRECGLLFPYDNLTFSKYQPNITVCKECMPSLVSRYKHTCSECGTSFIASFANDPILLCGLCRAKNIAHESKIVQSQIRRTTRLGRESALTLEEWIRAIEYFKGICPYCGLKTYGEMDHYIAVANGGSTNAQNCIPICVDCNESKGEKTWQRDDIDLYIHSFSR
jgi:5-methylcytosine-specific restriction endonuclease McrA